MGGDGSGRLPETTTVGEVLMNDEAFKAHVTDKAVECFTTLYDTLLGIVKGNATEEVYDSKSGVMVQRRASLDVRVKAAKVLKEMTLDKVISDKKTVESNGQGGLFDHLEALNKLADVMDAAKKEQQRLAEKSAEEAGTLKRLPAGG